ncbi:MAG: AAA family ATPase [Thermodesulfobacteriota bacterium]
MYVFRPITCRLFGFSVTRDRMGRDNLAACRIIRRTSSALFEAARSFQSEAPCLSDMGLRLYSLDPNSGDRLLPINEALEAAIRRMGLYLQISHGRLLSDHTAAYGGKNGIQDKKRGRYNIWYIFTIDTQWRPYYGIPSGDVFNSRGIIIGHSPGRCRPVSAGRTPPTGGAMRIIAISNQKGGCGKTTTAVNLSACLARKGKSVLLIDMDPQAHSSIALNLDVKQLETSVRDALGGPETGRTRMDEIVVAVSEHLHIAPADITLSALEQQLAMVPGRENRLKEAIAGMDREYEYVIVDCPPSLGLLTFNALIAATEIIVPLEMSLFSLHGVSRLLEIIGLVREKTGHEPRIRILATMVDDRTRISREVLADIGSHFKEALFATRIHFTVKLKEAASFGKSIVDYGRDSRGRRDYLALTEEVIAQDSRPASSRLREKSTIITRQFTLDAPRAASVKIVGTFNDWTPSEKSAMEQRSDGVWTKELSLTPGDYQYRFLVDDVWTEDHANPHAVDNAFGGKNSCITIR